MSRAINMALLPSYFVLKSDKRYLSVTKKIPENLPSGFLKFDEEQIWSPRVKFAVEPSQTTRGLAHIRSCYNNKYLVAKQIDNNIWIVASAKKPEEDQSKDSCTLFEPYSLAEETTTVRLRHVQTRISATHSLSGTDGTDTHQGVLVSSSTGSGFNAIDWDTLVILPSQVQVAFRSEDLEGKYLCSVTLDKWYPYQKFEPKKDVGDPLVAKELVPTSDGNYRIFDVYFGKFWIGVPQWIRAEAESNNNSKETLFSFVKISDTLIALKNLGSNQYCGNISMDYKDDVLRAEYPTLSRQTKMTLEECVLDREISDVIYRLSDARIYEEKIQEVANAFAVNDSPTEKAEITLTYSTADSRTTSWNNSVSLNLGVKVTFKVAYIPFIASGEITQYAELGYTHEWGGSETTNHKREATYTITVPPLTTMKVNMMCTTAACDVPFSYTQRDLLTTGQLVTTKMDDGIFNGISSYNFYFQSSEETKDSQGRLYI